MASSSRSLEEVEERYACIDIEGEEEGVEIDALDSEDGVIFDDRFCLVGRFLNARSVDFDAMRHTLAGLWKPGKGLFVKELGPNLYLFQFYHEIDIKRVINGSPWTFNRLLFLFGRVPQGGDPKSVPLNRLDMWVQIHGLTSAFMTERVVKEAAKVIGEFVESDPKNSNGLWRDFLRVRVRVNIDQPIKRRMKLKKVGGDWFWVPFKYEFLPSFCYICGIIGHTENFCHKLFDTPEEAIVKPYGEWLRAQTRRKSYLLHSQYLRTGTEVDDQTFGPREPAATVNADEDPVPATGTTSRGKEKLPVLADGGNHGHTKSQPFSPNIMGGNQAPLFSHSFNRNSFIENIGQNNLNVPKTTNLLLVNGENSDHKRRRPNDIYLVDNGPNEVDFMDSGPNDGMEAELIISSNNATLPKNGLLVGSGVQDLVIQKKPNFIFLCETLCRKEVVERIRVAIGFDGLFAVDAIGRSGGVALLWRNNGDINLLRFAHNYIDVEVTSFDQGVWRLTGFYGEPNRSARVTTWDQLKTLATVSSLPWCVIGDLNNILSHEDKRGGIPYPNWLIEGFQQTIQECELSDMELVGHQFTWEKSRGSDAWIESRLDRALVSKQWLVYFSSAQLLNLELSSSDHSPLLLNLVGQSYISRHKQFRFENFWLREPMCFQVVKDCWVESALGGIQEKIKLCGNKLTEWNNDYLGKFHSRLKHWKSEAKKFKAGRDDVSLRRFKEAENNLFEVLNQKEIFWRQRSKQLWLQEGDQNTKYFHATATSRRRSNLIHKLQKDDGTWADWDNGLPDVIVDYFKTLFSSGTCQSLNVTNGISPTISEAHNVSLLAPITDEEVKDALFQMHPDKAPDPDGMTPAFYQKCWHIVGKDVIKQVRSFFLFGSLPEGLNHTNIVLIPKKKNPSHMSDLRPIALCNVLYKVCSKVLANRLKVALPLVISDNQSAFIPGRLITDNIMISFEVMHYLKRKRMGKDGYMAVKLDMSKAYDRVEWSFLCDMMLKMGFDSRVVHLIYQCISTVTYSVTHGGHALDPFTPSRGIRQGDPLSPYLFLICAEGFSSLIKSFEAQGELHGCRVCNGAPIISHMLFADDSYLYCKAIDKEALNVIRLLQLFEQASGQQVNFAKSTIFFSSNTTESIKARMCSLLGMVEAPPNSLYLGLPCTMGRNKNAILGFLKDKMEKRILSWEGRLLSKAGKEVLVKTVAQALPSYAMSVFLLPIDTCNKLEGMMAKFWWRSDSSKSHGVHWKSWQQLTKHKHFGGLGFRDLRDFNLSMLGKQAWRLIVNETSLVSRLYKARYFPRGSFFNAELGHNPSFIWKSIFDTQKLVLSGVRCNIGSGTSINIQRDPWLPDASNPFVTTQLVGLDDCKVASLMESHDRRWDLEVLNDLFNTRDRDLICKLPISSASSDFWYWSLNSSGVYKVKDAYNLLHKEDGLLLSSDEKRLWKIAWNINVPPKVLHFLWRSLSETLPTKVQLVSRHVPLDLRCPMCNFEDESIVHLLIECSFAQSCWHRSSLSANVLLGGKFSNWFESSVLPSSTEIREEAVMICWAIWNARNAYIWKGKSTSASDVILSARVNLNQWKNAQLRKKGPLFLASGENEGSEHWSKPVTDKIKVNVDGAIFEAEGWFGTGLVARNCHGHLIEARSCSEPGYLDAAVVEAIGIKEALSWIKDKQWQDVQLETDCLVAVQALHSSVPLRSPFGVVIQECKELLVSLKSVQIQFVKRSANKAAHYMARSSCFHSVRMFIESTAPDDLLNIVMVDSIC
ncbi:hypothetical protein CsatA_019561 [Cannabis sativa]